MHHTPTSDVFSFPSPPPARPAAVGEQGAPRHRHKSSSERCKDYFHGSRAVPLMRLTQKWTRHYMARHWHDRMGLLFFYCCCFFFRLLDEPRLYFLSRHTGISTASSCTSLRFTAAGSLDGPAAPIASPNGFAHGVLLMHVMRSYMSQWAVNHKATSRFSVVVNNDANESMKCGQ